MGQHYEVEKIMTSPEELPYMKLAQLEQSTIAYGSTEFDQRSYTAGAEAAARISNASLKARARTDADAAIDLGLR